MPSCSAAARACALALLSSLACGPMVTRAGVPMAPGFVETGRDILGLGAVTGRFAVADVDGDGLPDLVFCSESSAPVLLVLGKRNDGTLGFKQSLVIPTSEDTVRLLATPLDGVVHLLMIGAQGSVRDYSGWPLAESRRFNVDGTGGVTAAAVGDLYGDGRQAIVVATAGSVAAYAVDTGSPLWTYANPYAYDLALAQLDDDPALEVIVGSQPGLVIDGATQATDWSYADGFGGPLASGHLLGDSTTQFLAGAGDYFNVFRGDPWSPLWSGTGGAGGIESLATATFDDSGRDVILEGDSQWGAVHVIDAATHQDRLQIPNPGWGVSAVTSADLDGDGVPDVAFAADSGYGQPSIDVANSRSGATEWSFTTQYGSFSSVALGDVDGDGQLELIVAGNDMGDNGPIEIYDDASGALKWQSPLVIGNLNDPFYISTSRILLWPHTSDAGQDIVFAGNSSYDGRIIVVDGSTHEVKLQIGNYGAGPLESRSVNDVALVDFDGDGVPDIVAGTSPTSTGADGALLQVFSGADGHVLWTSVPMAPGFADVLRVWATGPASDASSELVAALPGSIRAYNIQTHLLDWSLAVTADGATYVPHGANGPEFAVFQHNGAVTFYDAATQVYLRSYLLPSPLNALLPLEGDLHRILASAADGLRLVDGASGSTLATTPFLGDGVGESNQLAEVQAGDSFWHVASGNGIGVFRHDITQVPDTLFANGFEL